MSNLYPTPHIAANPSDFAKTVLMPGDPHRSRLIAENFLENPVLINDIRGVQGYTGTYRGVKISVMASGMGVPSMGIYSYELFNIFGVENIIRVGSAGAYRTDIKVRDIVLAQGGCTDSNFAYQFTLPGHFAPIADFELLRDCAALAEKKKLPFHVGNVVTSDVFYGGDDSMKRVDTWAKMGVMAVEMEAAALYMNALRAGKRALCICTISDHLLTGETTAAKERQESFTDMIHLALDTAAGL